MSAHTPGPWVNVGQLGMARWIVAANGRQVAMAYYGASEQGRANARLIAAAPELLEALRSAYQFHRVVECISEPTQGGEECSCQAFDPVRAAIAKAEGKP